MYSCRWPLPALRTRAKAMLRARWAGRAVFTIFDFFFDLVFFASPRNFEFARFQILHRNFAPAFGSLAASEPVTGGQWQRRRGSRCSRRFSGS